MKGREAKGRGDRIEGRPTRGGEKVKISQLKLQIICRVKEVGQNSRDGQTVGLNQLRRCKSYKNKTISVKLEREDIKPD
jgi:hypothetical protein